MNGLDALARTVNVLVWVGVVGWLTVVAGPYVLVILSAL